ncbi:MAG: helix-turn-helix transcriptional regulator [Clostridia bacterium]|nr:helix-turn-helix transcriptional regulator [Clostridia bacterium]
MEHFTHIISGEYLNFKHAYGVADRDDREFHPFHEIVYFIHGNTLFLSDSVSRVLEEKTLIYIPKETYHQFSFLSDPEDYQRCIFQFYDTAPSFSPISESMREIRLMPCADWMERTIELLTKKACAQAPDNIILLEAVMLMLLYGATEEGAGNRNSYRPPRLEAAISHIENNLAEPLLIPAIAEKCGLSVSGLSHLFQSELHISVHRYILNKRLAVAYNKILGGASPMSAARECGFSNYSGFFKQFRKRFDTSPSRIQNHRFEP